MIEKELICGRCAMRCKLKIQLKNNKVQSIAGNKCRRGRGYALGEYRKIENVKKLEN